MALVIENEQIKIHAGHQDIEANFRLPENCIGTILFAHGGVSSRLSPPDDYVGSVLRSARFATLWVDLLAPHEARNFHIRSNIAVLTERLTAACDWLVENDKTKDLPLSLFGAGPAAAAALQCAAFDSSRIASVVSRGGRPDLVECDALAKIIAPTLFIVGGLDEKTVALNRTAYASLRCMKRFEIIPGATYQFEEPGNLEVVARLTRTWFQAHSHFRSGVTHA